MSPHCDPELENSKSIFLHSTLVHDGASPYQVWLQKVQRLRKYRWDEHSLESLTFPVTLTLTTTEQIQSFYKTIQLMIRCHQTKFLNQYYTNITNIILVAKGSAIQKIYYKVIVGDMNTSLWPWPWRQQTNIFGRQFGSWWCITVPSLVV